jgi:hypothetical protein
LRIFRFLLLFLLDSYFARADTANPDSGDVLSPNAPVEDHHGAFGVGRNQGGFKLKPSAKFFSARAFETWRFREAGHFTSSPGRAFAFHGLHRLQLAFTRFADR